ncbi:MAG TPA: glycoside hydrolase family 99-like domain-containing protein [Rhodopila sp.]
MRIIIGLIEHIGDIVACEPVSRYVRDQYPDAHISWAVLPQFRELIDTNPHIDETVPLECLTEWIRLSKHGEYGVIVDLHVNYRICQHCMVPLVKEHGNPFINAYEWFDYGALLEAFSLGAGLPRLSAQPRLYLGPEHEGAVDALGLPAEYCVIHRQSNDFAKDWPSGNWRAVAEWIRTDLGLPIVEVGAGRSDAASPLDGLAIDLLNRTPILQTAEVIRRARLFVGVDSGPAHLANAVQTPGVVLLGRLGMFRQYNPFTGYYASDSPEVKLVRNAVGPAREIAIPQVKEAIQYISSILKERDSRQTRSAAAPLPVEASATLRVSHDDRAAIEGCGLYNRSWYVVHYPDVLSSGMEPLDHFVARGGQLGYSPGPDFNTAEYLKRHDDVARAGVNPLLHYLHVGRHEGRQPTPVVPQVVPSEILATSPWEGAGAPSSPFCDDITVASVGPDVTREMPRIFAFYLPQFHPIEENNQGHRMGFTEWNNVISAKPLFDGHYQPRVPGELGYYDLRAVEVMREQVRLANDHGISGFCFYYYYFNGRKLLYKPIQNYIDSDIKAPFFFLWANENWSRRWDGGDNEVIIAQQHSAEDDLVFIRSLLDVFADERYEKVDGKPVLMVYKTHLFPDISATTDLWRNEIVRHGFPGLYLVMVDDWTANPLHPRLFGFDAAYEIPSNIVPKSVICEETERPRMGEDFRGRIVDYPKFARYHMSRVLPEYKRFRTVMLPWDNTPRYASEAMVHINAGGDDYRTWLTRALLDTHDRYAPEERIVFIHSWNEWCEGTYLEPDGRAGRHFLEQTREAVADARTVLALTKQGGDASGIALAHRIAQKKDTLAFRMMQSMRTQAIYIHRELERVRSELAMTQARAENAEAHADNVFRIVYGSTSWRVTAPLRFLSKWLRHR